MTKRLFGLSLLLCSALPVLAQIEVNTGNVTVRVLYKGQQMPYGCRLYFSSQTHGFGCGASYTGVTTGSFTLTESHGYPFPPINFTINAGQTTIVDVETSSVVGVVSGLVQVNGQIPNPGVAILSTNEDGNASTDGTGRFNLLALAGPGTGSVIGSYSTLATFPFNAVAGQTVDVGTISASTGNVTVRVLYKGQQMPYGCRLYFSSQTHGFGCGTSYSNVNTGSFTLTESHGYPFPPVNFTINAGQTTIVDVETSGVVGVVTGLVRVNGQIPNPPVAIISSREDGQASTDPTGRFYLVALAGPGTGFVTSNYSTLATFAFNAVAGQTRDLGTIGSTTLNGVIVAKSGSLPTKQWSIRIQNTGINTAANTQLDNFTLVQTFGSGAGPACNAPSVTSTFPIAAGLLAPGTNVTVPVSINFGNCAPNARFTATLTYSANGGSATGTKSLSNQQP